MKKALAGPAKRTAKKKPERRAMIAAARGRFAKGRRKAAKTARRRADLALWWATKQTRRADRAANRWIERAHPVVVREARRARRAGRRWSTWLGKRLRPLGARFFKALAAGERAVRRAWALAARAGTRASAVVTPERAIAAVVVAAAGCLVAAQFVDYRGVEIGQPGYVGLPSIAPPPAVDVQTAGSAHSYLLVPLALAAAALAIAAVGRGRRRLGRAVFAIGLVAIAVILLVDLPHGLDAGAQTSRFAGATAVLYDGFYAELAAAAAIALGGLALSLGRQPARQRARRSRSRPSRPQRPRRDPRALNSPQPKRKGTSSPAEGPA
jgi:hypothetical protein